MPRMMNQTIFKECMDKTGSEMWKDGKPDMEQKMRAENMNKRAVG